MKHRYFSIPLIAAICVLLPSCDDSGSKKDQNPVTSPCPTTGSSQYCSGTTQVTCINGAAYYSECDVCEGNGCVTPNTCAPESFAASCKDDRTATVCVNNTISNKVCNADEICKSGECEKVSTGCSESEFTATCADANSITRCEGGSITTSKCEYGCSNNKCNDKPDTGDSICGNRKLESGEVCDTWEVGELTCADVPDIEPLGNTEKYLGQPKCNDDCTAIEIGSCYKSKCGNGYSDAGELCDASSSQVHSTFPSCDDYYNAASKGLSWKPGGEPGCSSDCKGYSKGTCQLEDQPRDGITSCEFSNLSLVQYEGSDTAYLQGDAVVITDGSIEDDNKLLGELACGHRTTETYTWSLKSGVYGSSITQSTTDPNTYSFQAWLDPSSWHAGEYDCIFRVNARGGNGSFYLCPIIQGPPAEQGITDELKIRTYTVEGEEVSGNILAYWDFESGFDTSGSGKPTATKLYPSEGELTSGASFSVTGDSKGNDVMTMLSGTGSYGTYAASAANWSKNSSLSDNDKHFVVSFSTLGYQNIHVKMEVATSSSSKNQLAAKYFVGSLASSTITHNVQAADKTFETWEFDLESAANASTVTLNLYSFGNSDANATFRVDDLYILGEKM